MMTRPQGGFTLVELMIVVVIIGVLSVLAVTGYRKYKYAARNAEAVQFLGAVRAEQHAYFEAYGRFCGSTTPAVWPPEIPTVQTGKVAWESPESQIPDNNAWSALGIRSPGQVWFQYRMAAGRAGETGGAAIADSRKAWFWAQANGDFDGNRVKSTFEVTSEKPDVFIVNENE